MNATILLIEDEMRMREILSDYLTAAGFHVVEAADGREGMEAFEQSDVDLVLLDIMMPELDGWTVCRRIRKTSNVPIVIITARTDEDDALMGYDFGADDYVTKPLSPKVLVAKVKTLLKRAIGSQVVADATIRVHDLAINTLSRTVTLGGDPLDLTPKEYELLLFLVKNKGIVLSREQILNTVWGYDYFGDGRTVDTHITRIRSKLGAAAEYIKTVIRSGYKFEVE